MSFRYRGHPSWLRPHPLGGWGDGVSYGAARVPGLLLDAPDLHVIFSSPDPDDLGDVSAGWEHVSVSTTSRVPTWPEMCRVKALFWDDEDCVVQFHPPRSEYVDECRTCLHLWRYARAEFPRPPRGLVGSLR